MDGALVKDTPERPPRKKKDRARSVVAMPSGGLPMTPDAYLSDRGAQMKFDFTRMISELNDEIKDKDKQLEAAKNFCTELGDKLDVVETERATLLQENQEFQLQIKQQDQGLKLLAEENTILQDKNKDIQQELKNLRDDKGSKEREVVRLSQHLTVVAEETESLRRGRAQTTSMMKQAQSQKEKASLEKEAAERQGRGMKLKIEQLNARISKRDRQLKTVEKECETLRTQLTKVQKLRMQAAEDNSRMKAEMHNLKMMCENKTFELMDAQRELESLRRQAAESGGRPESAAFGTLASQPLQLRNVGSTGSDGIRQRTDSNQSLSPRPTSFGRKYSEGTPDEGNQSLFVMLQQADNFEEDESRVPRGDSFNQVEQLNSPLPADEEKTEENVQNDDLSKSNDPFGQMSRTSKKDMLVVYLYLTAAAVKYRYPDVDIKNSELIRMGQDMAFWELYPFFTHMFESLKKKTLEAEQRKARKEGGWLGWLRRPRGKSAQAGGGSDFRP